MIFNNMIETLKGFRWGGNEQGIYDYGCDPSDQFKSTRRHPQIIYSDDEMRDAGFGHVIGDPIQSQHINYEAVYNEAMDVIEEILDNPSPALQGLINSTQWLEDASRKGVERAILDSVAAKATSRREGSMLARSLFGR